MSWVRLVLGRRVPLYVSLPVVAACGAAGFIVSTMQPGPTRRRKTNEPVNHEGTASQGLSRHPRRRRRSRAHTPQCRATALGGTRSPAGWVVRCEVAGRRNRSSNTSDRCARRRCAITRPIAAAVPQRLPSELRRIPLNARGPPSARCGRHTLPRFVVRSRLPNSASPPRRSRQELKGLPLIGQSFPCSNRRSASRPLMRRLSCCASGVKSSSRDARLRRFNREGSYREGSVRRLVDPAPAPSWRRCSRRGWCRPGRRR